MKKSILSSARMEFAGRMMLLTSCMIPVTVSATRLSVDGAWRGLPEGTPEMMRNGISGAKTRNPLPLRTKPLPGFFKVKNVSGKNVTARLMGNVIFSNYDENYVFDHPYGIYSFDTEGNFELVGGEGIYSNSHAVRVGDSLYSFTNDYVNGAYQVTLNVYSTSDWSLVRTDRVSTEFIAQSNPSYDRVSGLIYGTFLNSTMTGYEFCSVDLSDMTRTVISDDLRVQWISSFIDPDGNLYMIGQDGKIYRVDKSNGELTNIGDTGFPTNYGCSATYDPLTEKGYWAAFFGYASYLIEIDPSTGKSEVVYEFESCDEIMGLMPAGSDSAIAPDAPSELQVQLSNGSLSCDVSFTMPVTNIKGDVLNGALSWLVETNGVASASGTASPGEKVTVPLTVDTDGWYRFVVTCSDTSGKGLEAAARIYVGHDSPEQPAGVRSVWDNGVFSITWEPVVRSANGGYVDFSNLKYDVYRCPGNVKVADGITETSFVDSGVPSGSLNLYYHEVVAKADGKESSPGISNKTVLGEKIYPPFSNDFSSREAFGIMRTIDGNDDGTTWIWDEDMNAARIKFGEVKMDDWLVTPPVHLEAGEVYRYNVGMHCVGDEYPEEFEIRMGDTPTAEGMTTVIMPETTIASRSTVYYEHFIEVDKTGDYYIGVHGVSDANLFYIYVDEFSISGNISKAAPEEVENVMIRVDKDDYTRFDVSFNAPQKDIVGNVIDIIDRIEVTRDGEIVKTFTGVRPGDALSFTDIVPQANKAYTWRFAPFNANGVGKVVEMKAFAGINIPGKCPDVDLAETEEKGVVILSWKAPALDEQGYPFNAENCTYTIVASNGSSFEPLVSGITSTSHTFRAIDEGKQAFKTYGVRAVSSKGAGAVSYSAEIPVGTPYRIPWTESFPDMTMNSIFGVNYLENMPNILLSSRESMVTPKDNDGGFMVIESQKSGTSARIFTGKIDLSETESPQFVCYVFNYADGMKNMNELTLQVSVDQGRTFIDRQHYVIGEDCGQENGWNRLNLDLSEYAGKEIIIGWVATIRNYEQIHIDALAVQEKARHDIELKRISAPSNIGSGVEFGIDVDILNVGSERADGYKVVLSRQGKDFMEQAGKILEPGAASRFTFKTSLCVLDDEKTSWQARVDWDSDIVPENNISGETTTTLMLPSWPTVRNLQCAGNGHMNRLTWEAPEIDRSEPDTYTESFESFEPFATKIAGWTFHDGDKAPIGGFENVQFPIPYLSNQSFWVHDTGYQDGSVFVGESYAAHSGNKYLASLFRQDDKTVDDWAISPALSGKSQIVGVWAKSYDPQYKESFEILYSEGSLNPEDFKVAERFDGIASEWTEYRVQLPDGARRFAIRSVGTGAFMFMVDDVSYVPESFADLHIVGYNVYRNRILITENPVEVTSLDDVAGEAVYHVSVVYSQGESEAVDTATSGLREIPMPEGVRVEGNNGLLILGAQGKHVEIVTSDGMAVYSGNGHDTMRLGVAPGIYIVAIDNFRIKTIVR